MYTLLHLASLEVLYTAVSTKVLQIYGAGISDLVWTKASSRPQYDDDEGGEGCSGGDGGGGEGGGGDGGGIDGGGGDGGGGDGGGADGNGANGGGREGGGCDGGGGDGGGGEGGGYDGGGINSGGGGEHIYVTGEVLAHAPETHVQFEA